MINGNGYAIIANPEGDAWEFAKEIYSKMLEIDKKRKKDSKDKRDTLEGKIEMIEIKFTKFRDGEFKTKITKNVRRKTCFFVHDSSLPPSDWLTQLTMVNNALELASASEIIDVLPYLLFSRQDRKDESRVAINAKVIADTIGLYADGVMTIDLHAPQIQGFYPLPLDNLFSSPFVIDYLFTNYKELLNEDLAIMSPDAGGVPRAKNFKELLNKKYRLLNKKYKKETKETSLIIGSKQRPREGEVGDYIIIGDVKEKTVFIIDDILDSGGTLMKAAESLKKVGAKEIYAYVTHGLFTEGFDRLKPYFEKIFVSNTRKIPFSDEKLEIIDITGLLAEAIYRTINGESLSALFE